MIHIIAALINTDLPKTKSDSLIPILNVAFGILGAISLLVVTIAGIQFAASGGDPQKVAKARNTIFYALIGLGVAIFAAVIVDFVIAKVT
jgi:hypothetical protein